MLLDTTLIDEYIRTKSTVEIEKHWIFNKIVEGKHLFADPPLKHLNKIINNRSLISKKLKNFEPTNNEVWTALFGDRLNSTTEQIAMLIVGAPEPYDAFVRKDQSGNNVMVFDVERLINITNPAHVINGIITHEVAHTLIHRDFQLYNCNLNSKEVLKQMLFDEGFAHYVSFLKLKDLHSDKQYVQYKQQVYNTLKEVLKSEITQQNLIDGNSGSYWSKYISISGLFTIVDYLNGGGDITELYQKGYENFFKYWQSIVS
ncbi:hypothetical protein IMX26_16410 [Clostridium sp. 'deep sea']|uniref:hypothetical protein n=1 Tax=Clostridium sp. 'deep sea' TaxID=2779445 RepID=UPI00189698AC|nr:hypothetical protein [Clostridium sp. 'deep sea']QOR35022.1 hypothetical protein IMX26_16410 [Clostridium sp. 'deep sea']